MQFNKHTHTHTNTHTHTHIHIHRKREERERDEALRQAHVPIREGSVGVNSSNAIKGAAYIGRHALVLGHVIAASAQGGLPSFLERLREQPMATSLLEELKTVATEVKRSQIEDAVGSSWVTLAVEDDSQWSGIGTLLVQTGAGGGRGREEGQEGRRWEDEGERGC